MRLNAIVRSVALLAAVLLFALSAFAQSDNSTISGFVKDPSGAAIANAKVVIKNEGTAFERQTTTNETGFFTVTNLSPGYYSVTIEAAGFKTFTRTRNKLEAAIPISVNVDMAVGQLTETVNVEASVAQLNTESATVGKTVEQMQIQNMSLNGRNPLFLALLKPGVRGGALNGFNFGLTSGSLTINGGRSQDSLITFDGAVGIRTRANGISVGTADVDTIQEVQILTANYSAEYGRSSAGQIRMVTRSGSRDFHGSFYEYFRNSRLDANSWSRNRNSDPAVNSKAAPFRYNQFGYNFSGPVTIPKVFNTSREKLFFLWSQEWVRYRREDSSTQRVPTLAMKGGDFSELLSPTNMFYGSVKTIKDPLTGNPFPGNIIPKDRLSQNGTGFLKAYYAPTGLYPGNANWFMVRPNWQNQRKDTVALDYNPTQNQVIRFRHANYNWTALDAFRSGFDYAITDWNRPNKTASVSHTWTLSPTMINEFLAAASVDRVYIGVDRQGERYLRSRHGINYPYIFPEKKEIYDKVPTIVIPQVNQIDGGPYPSSSTGPIYNFSNNFTKIHSNHTFKFGALFERSGQNDFDQINVSGVPGGTNNQNGRFEFVDSRPGGTGIGLADAALGLFSRYAEIGPRAFTPYRSHMFEFFGQDSWRVTEKLKLEIGGRGTWMNGYYKSLWGNIAIFRPDKYDPSKAVVQDPKTGVIISGDRFNGVVIPGKSFPDAAKGRVPAIDSGEYNRLLSGGSAYPASNRFVMQPRLGLAYQITSKQVLRAGFGSFVSRPGVYDNVFLGGNPPFQPMVSVSNGIADNPGGASNVAFPQFFMTIDPVYKVPLSYNWNATYQRNLPFETTIEIGYVGTAGNFLAREHDLNQLPTGTLFKPENLNPNGSLKYNQEFLRPYKGFANINMEEHSGRSTYNGLQIEATRRFKRGLSYGVAYTWSKAMDNNTGLRDAFIDAYNQQLNWGKSGNDTRHVAVMNFIWEMPFFNSSSGLAKTALGGWQLSGVMQFQTGTPISIGRSDDYLGIGSTVGKPWNLNGTPNRPQKFSNSASDSNFWFEQKVGDQLWATKPANGTLPNQNRNSIAFNNVGFQNWNMAMFKDFRFQERQSVQFRFEAFNWPNHPNWNGVNTDPANLSTFGKVNGKGSERNLQLSLRYSF